MFLSLHYIIFTALVGFLIALSQVFCSSLVAAGIPLQCEGWRVTILSKRIPYQLIVNNHTNAGPGFSSVRSGKLYTSVFCRYYWSRITFVVFVIVVVVIVGVVYPAPVDLHFARSLLPMRLCAGGQSSVSVPQFASLFVPIQHLLSLLLRPIDRL